MSDDKIQKTIADHYEKRLKHHGDNFKGVNYTFDEIQNICFQTILEVIKDTSSKVSLLDVGCGLAHLLDYIRKTGMNIDYSGLDITAEMIKKAQGKYPETDFYNMPLTDLPSGKKFDFVVAIGVLTRKTEQLSDCEFESYMLAYVEKMYSLCNYGIAFNAVTSYVDYRKDDLYYADPKKIFDFCRSKLSRHVCIRHDYPLWDYSVYVYKPEYMKFVYKFYR